MPRWRARIPAPAARPRARGRDRVRAARRGSPSPPRSRARDCGRRAGSRLRPRRRRPRSPPARPAPPARGRAAVSTLPSASRRSSISNTMRRGMSGGARRLNRSTGRSMRSRAMVRMSLKPAVVEQRERRPAALDDRIRADRRAVHDQRLVLDREAARPRASPRARPSPPSAKSGGVDGTLNACDRGISRLVAVPHGEIGEGSADIDADAKHAPMIGAACAPRSPACDRNTTSETRQIAMM